MADECKYRTFVKAVKDVNVEITMYTYEETLESMKRGNQFVKMAIDKEIPIIGEELVKKCLIQ
ncbi:hypothetical protein DRN86_03805 [Candidatus Geothermarchaeota archaeon]|nr:MAG: hypothetical protein DRN86_03805 [Candidatus Geothermarchaeota archaeon]